MTTRNNKAGRPGRGSRAEIPPTPENVRAALSYIDPNEEHKDWITTLFAVYDALGNDGRDLAEDWSRFGESYKAADFKDAWKSASKGGKTTVATLWYKAKQKGWKPDGKAYQETEADRQKREREREERNRKAEQNAKWKRTKAATNLVALGKAATDLRADHPYLTRKSIKPVSTLLEVPVEQATKILGYHPKAKSKGNSDGEPLEGRLIVAPVKVGGKLSTLEFIDEQGRKSAMAGGAKAGGFWATQALPEGDGTEFVLAIGEGVATVLSTYQVTDYPAIAALSAGNILTVAKAMRDRYPKARLLILADAGNGQEDAEKAARETGAALVVPTFTPEQIQAFQEQRPKGKPPKDFNDLHQIAGPEAVQAQIAAALEAGPYVAAPEPTPSSGTPAIDFSLEFPPVEEGRPCYAVYEKWCGPNRKHPPGVYFHGVKGGNDKEPPTPINARICSPLYIDAVTCGEDGRNFGRLLRLRDTFENWRLWAMPMEMLAGSCEELRRELLAAGLEIVNRERARLPDYLGSEKPERRVIAANCTGWTRDGAAFVLPERIIGSEDVFYQAETMHQGGGIEARGDFDSWKNEVAAPCEGNLVLVLSVCVALAGPLLAKVHRDSGGIHWVGDSSIGKTTGLNVGGSVWGGDTFRRTWRATANGLEGVAAALNDTCLCLDEISEADPREIGAVIYSLGNGTGKTRAHRTGTARHTFHWRVTLLSTGERTLVAQMAEGGKQTKAGQELRLLSIPAARTHGAFDTLHRFPTGRALADHLKTMCGRHYGHAGPAFIEAMWKDGRDFGADLAEIEALNDFQAANSQEARAASRFALYAMAGELAVEWGILPWNQGEALAAAAETFQLWRESRGAGITEDRQILQAVADFISKHGDGRFSRKGDGNVGTDGNGIFRDRAGWWTDTEAGRVYLITSEGLREATKGYDTARALAALDRAGWIYDRTKDGTGRLTKKTDVGGGRKPWLYWILPGEDGV